jgi:AraC-like DNA-binding protein
MTQQINIFLLLFGALQGILLSLWFLKNEKKRLANLYFAFFLLVIGLQLTFKVITKMWLMENVFYAYNVSYKLPYIIGPLLYLYVKARKDNSFYIWDLLNFLPFVAAGIIANFYDVHPYFQAFFQILSLVVYGILSLRLKNFRLNKFIATVVSAEVLVAITLAVMYMYYPKFSDVRLFFICLTVLIYWVSYKAISQPDLFVETVAHNVIKLEMQRTRKYAHSSLKSEESKRIAQELQHLMYKEKAYIDSSLTIDSLSAKIRTSRHHLSQVINEHLNKTYLDLITELRLDEARRKLSDPSNLRFTIAALALDSGFNSVSNFNEVFKKQFGTTPSRFRDQQLKKMSA